MKAHPLTGLALLAALVFSPFACAAPPSDQVIDEFLVITRGREALEALRDDTIAQMKEALANAVKEQSINAQQQKIIDDTGQKLAASVTAVMTWDALKKLVYPIYKRNFTHDELAGVVNFYKTPVGKAYASKMPVIAQESFAASQKLLELSLQKNVGIMEEGRAQFARAQSATP